MTIPIEKIREAFEALTDPAFTEKNLATVGEAITELEAARKEIEIFKGANEHLRETEAALLQVIRDLREEVRRKDRALRCIAEHPQQEHLHSSGRQCEAVMSQIALIALSPKSTEPERCPEREDGTHCVHWWDGEEPCCACGDNTDPKSTEDEDR